MKGQAQAAGHWTQALRQWGGRVRARIPPALWGYALAIMGTACLCATYVVSKIVVREIGSESFNVVWFAFGFLITMGYLLISGQREEVRLKRQYWGQVALLGLVNAFSMGAFFKAIELIDPVLVSFFFRLEIVTSVLAGVFLLGERLGARELGGMVLAITGAGIITYASGHLVLTGLLLVIFSAAFYTGSWLVARSCMSDGCSPTALAGFRALGTSFFLGLYVLATGRWHPPSLHAVLWMLGGAFFGPFLANSLNYRAIMHIGVARMSIIRNVQPLFLIPVAYLFLGTVPGLRQLAGGVVVLAGVLLVVLARLREARPVAEPRGGGGEGTR
ncbi:MAG: DMT family transporter [Anaerolineae bacterium]